MLYLRRVLERFSNVDSETTLSSSILGEMKYFSECLRPHKCTGNSNGMCSVLAYLKDSAMIDSETISKYQRITERFGNGGLRDHL